MLAHPFIFWHLSDIGADVMDQQGRPLGSIYGHGSQDVWHPHRDLSALTVEDLTEIQRLMQTRRFEREWGS